MPYLLDTNVLLRWAQPHHPLNPVCVAAVSALAAAGEDVFVTPQNLIEFWNAATRPFERNGFGMTPAQAEAEVSRLEALFPLAPDTQGVYPEWRRLW
jgi:predicted nucleic acid-binding protein